MRLFTTFYLDVPEGADENSIYEAETFVRGHFDAINEAGIIPEGFTVDWEDDFQPLDAPGPNPASKFTSQDEQDAMRHAIDLLTAEAEKDGNWDRVSALSQFYERQYGEPVER